MVEAQPTELIKIISRSDAAFYFPVFLFTLNINHQGYAMFREIFSVFAGIFAAMIAITSVEAINSKLFPPPAGFDWHNVNQVHRFAASLPLTALLLILLGWILGAFIGAAVAAKISQKKPLQNACFVAGFVILGTIMNATQIPHPLWLNALGVLLPIPLAYLAYKLVNNHAT